MNLKEIIATLPNAHGLNTNPISEPASEEQQKYLLENFAGLINEENKAIILDNPNCLYDILLLAIMQNNSSYIENLYFIFQDHINLATATFKENLGLQYYSPLILANELCDSNTVEILLKNGMFDFESRHLEMNALMTALCRHKLDNAMLLLNYGAPQNALKYPTALPRANIINQTIQANLDIVKDQINRMTSASPNPARSEASPTPITKRSLAELFVGVYIQKFALNLDTQQLINFTSKIQTCINLYLPNNESKMKSIIKTLKTSDDPEIAELHTIKPNNFGKKFIELFRQDIQDDPPPIRTGRRI